MSLLFFLYIPPALFVSVRSVVTLHPKLTHDYETYCEIRVLPPVVFGSVRVFVSLHPKLTHNYETNTHHFS